MHREKTAQLTLETRTGLKKDGGARTLPAGCNPQEVEGTHAVSWERGRIPMGNGRLAGGGLQKSILVWEEGVVWC